MSQNDGRFVAVFSFHREILDRNHLTDINRLHLPDNYCLYNVNKWMKRRFISNGNTIL